MNNAVRILLRLILLYLALVFVGLSRTSGQQVTLVPQTGHGAMVSATVLSRNGRWLASASVDGTIKIWEAPTGQLLRTLLYREADSRRMLIEFSPDGSLIAGAGWLSQSVKLWSVATGREVRTLTTDFSINGPLAFSPDGKLVAVGCSREIRCWNVATGTRAFRYTWHNTLQNGQPNIFSGTFTFGSDNRTLVTADEQSVAFSDFVAKQIGRSLPIDAARSISVTLSPDASIIALIAKPREEASERYKLQLLDARSGNVLHTLMGTYPVVQKVQFSRDGRTVYAADEHHNLGSWDVASGNQLGSERALPWVDEFDIAPDGKTFAYGGGSIVGMIAFGSKALKPLWFVNGHSSGIALRADNRYFACVADTDAVILCDNVSGQSPKLLRLDAPDAFVRFQQVAFSPDGRLLAAQGIKTPKFVAGGPSPLSPERFVQIWRCVDWKLIRSISLSREGAISLQEVKLRFDSDSKTILCELRKSNFGPNASDETILRGFDVETGAERSSHSETMQSGGIVAFSADGAIEAIGQNHDPRPGETPLSITSGQITVVPWNLAGEENKGQTFALTRVITGIAFQPQGHLLAVGGPQSVGLRRIDPEGGGTRWFGWLCGGLSGQYAVRRTVYSRDGKLLACGGDAPAIVLMDGVSYRILRRLDNDDGPVNEIAFSPNGKTLAGYYVGQKVKLWEVDSGKLLRTIDGLKARDWVFLAFSADGARLLIGQGAKGNASVATYDVRSGDKLKELTLHGCLWAEPGPDARTLAASFGSQVKILDMETGAARIALSPPTPVGQVVFAPDGQTLACEGQREGVTLWNLKNGKLQRTLKTGAFASKVLSSPGLPEEPTWYEWHARFSSDGKTLAVRFPRSAITLWDVTTGTKGKQITVRDSLFIDFAFHPDGKTLVTGAMCPGDVPVDALKVWDVRNTALIRSDPGLAGLISVLAFSPDGKLLATSDNIVVTLWDVATQRKLSVLDGHIAGIRAVQFSADGQYLLSASADNLAQIWRISGPKPDLLCNLSIFADGTYAVVDSRGRYDASNGGEIQGLHWVVGNEPIVLSQLKARYYDPGLLSKYLGFNKGALRPVEKFGTLALYPEVKADLPVIGDGKLTINLTDQGGGIGHVQVKVNGKELTADARGSQLKADPRAKAAVLTVDLSKSPGLKPGEANDVEVVAYNNENWFASRGTHLVWRAPSGKAGAPPELYAIVAGIDTYSDPSLQLNLPERDARNMAYALILGAKRLFGAGKVHLTLLTGKKDVGKTLAALAPNLDVKTLLPTKANFATAFTALRAPKVKPSDLLVVYLAGHGASHRGDSDNDEYFYLTQEARSFDLQDPGVRQQSSVSSEELAEWTNRVPALKQVMILDTCAAGAAAKQLAFRRDLSSDEVRAIDRLKDRTGFYILMGCAPDAVSYESSQFESGVLTYALLQGMKGAKLREGEFVDVSSLFEYAADAVPNLAKSVGCTQQPQIIKPADAGSVSGTSSASFDIGELKLEDRQLIVLPGAMPQILHPTMFDPNAGFDDLDLTAALTKQLRAMSRTDTRGAATVVFVDADEMPGAVRPSGSYRVQGDMVTISIRLVQDGKPRGMPLALTGAKSDLPALVARMAQAIIDGARTQ